MYIYCIWLEVIASHLLINTNKNIKSYMDNTNVNQNQTPTRPDRRGNNNPFFGHRHTTQSREKMSQAATLRNQEYKKWRDSQHHISMDEFLSNNPQPNTKGYNQSQVKEDLLRKIIREEIQKLL